MAASATIRQGDASSSADKALAEDLGRRFFTDGSNLSRGAALYTTKDDVKAMKAMIAAEGLPYPRYQPETKTFIMSQESLSLKHAPAMSRVLERYGVGSEGHTAWDQERARDRASEATLDAALKSKAVRTGAYVDKRAMEDGTVVAGLVDQGVSGDKATLIAGENRRLLNERAASGEAVDRPQVLAQAVDAVRRDPVGVAQTLEQTPSVYGNETTERMDRFDSYVREANAHLGKDARFSSVYPHESVSDAVTMTVTDAKDHTTEWSMRYGIEGSSMPTHVGVRGKDPLFEDRSSTVSRMISPYYQPSDTRKSLISRSPLEPNAIKLDVHDQRAGGVPQEWHVKFKRGSAAVEEVLLDGRKMDVRQLAEMGAGFTPAARAVAKRLEHQPARKETVLFVPPSERRDFDALTRQKGVTARYDPKVTNEFGRPGGYILMGGDPADFARWQGREAHQRFVAEGDRLRQAPRDMLAAARYKVADADRDPYARYLAQGLKMPLKREEQVKWEEGYTDQRGRSHVGLNQASPTQLMELARLSAGSYQDLEREEGRIRLSLAVTKDTSWRTRYEKLPGSHEERIQALLPREAADKLPGFLALNHGQNRHLWTVRDPNAPDGVREEGLNPMDKQAMNALNRGFKYLSARYEELTNQSLGFGLTSGRNDDRSAQAAVDTSAVQVKQDRSVFFGRKEADAPEDKGSSPSTRDPAAPVAAAARPAAPKPAPAKRSNDGLDMF